MAGLAAVGAVWLADGAAAQTFPVQMARNQASYFKDVNRAVLPTYHLTFVTAQQATAVAGIGARARNTKLLTGVSDAAPAGR
jgi:hypothetical protein